MSMPALLILLFVTAPPSSAIESTWSLMCGPCHGELGDGNGPAAELYADGVPGFFGQPKWLARKNTDLVESISRGIPNSAMPGFGEYIDRSMIEALVRRIRTWSGASEPMPERSESDWWESPIADGGRVLFGAPQSVKIGNTHDGLSADACGRCHSDKFEQWSTSQHAKAVGPGLTGQYHGFSPEQRLACDRCHAPLTTQRTNQRLHAEGVTCAVCHVRHGIKHGPPRKQQGRSQYASRPESRFLRSDFCLPCHSLPPSNAVQGRPLLDTWREWAASSYLPQGVQCQDCHIPDGKHLFAGAQNRAQVARAIHVDLDTPEVQGRAISWTIKVSNTGAGHHFPTTATPRALIRVRQLRVGEPILGTQEDWIIGRQVRWTDGRWVEEQDSRIPAGKTLVRRYSSHLEPHADSIDVSVYFYPDWLYVGVYETLLGKKTDAVQRTAIGAALEKAKSTSMTLFYRQVSLHK